MLRAAGLGSRSSLASLAEFPWQPNIVRCYGTPAMKKPDVPVIKINSNLSLQRANSAGTKSPKDRPLVLLLSWLAAKQRHLDNFAAFYLSRGCDVLTVKLRPMQLLLPTVGTQVIARDVVSFLQSKEQRDRQILVHGFSVGGYLYGEIIQKMLASQTESHEITRRIIGQIYDSPVDLQNIPVGISKALTKNPLAQRSMQTSLQMYLRVMNSAATKHYHKSSYTFHHNPVSAPSLFFYSHTDPVGTAESNERVMSSLKTNMGYENVYSKAFEDSPHVSHMYKHQNEYMSTLKGFLSQIEYFREALVENKELADFVGEEGRDDEVEVKK
ncbi:transmembrane protein 53-like [Asterias amurensis]|uniref:transmembrane protein 53-like n=1 Tax=Asterias amurensis TaxID=7602 RepID=UPI003AB398C2